jgi:putative transposase
MTTLLKGDELVDANTDEVRMTVTSRGLVRGRVRVLREGEDVERLEPYEAIRKQINDQVLRLRRKGQPNVSAAKQNDPSLDTALARAMWVIREMRSYARTQRVSTSAAYEHAREKHAKEGLTWTFPGLSTVYPYLACDRRGLPALAGDANKGNRTRRRSPEVEELVCDIADTELLETESRWSIKAVARTATTFAKERGLLDAADSLSTKYVRRIIAENLSVDIDYDRLDPRTRTAAKSIASNRMRVTGLFERVEQDAIHLPWRVRTEFGFSSDVWLVHAIDCEAGMPVGWKLVIGAPRESDGLACVECILFSKRDKFKALGLEIDIDLYGTPRLLVFDNGPEAKGVRMKRLTRVLIDTLYLKSRHPQGKPFIERLNRSLKEALETLPGTTRFDGVDGSRDPEVLGDVDMDIKELERWIVRWYYEKWANTQLKRLRRTMFTDDRKLGNTPAERVYNRVTRDGYPLPLPPSPDDWKLTRFDHERRTLSRKTGISFLDYQFRGPNLKRLITALGESSVDILVDPDDWRLVYVQLGEELVELVNDATDEFSPALSFQEAKAQENEAKTSGAPHPKVAQFDKELSERSMSTGAKSGRQGKRETSKSTTTKAKEKAANDRAKKAPPVPTVRNHPEKNEGTAIVLQEDGSELQLTNRHTGEAA